MKFLLMTIGSAGDVHPFVALGAGLHRRGHDVSLATNAYFRPVVEGAGLAFLPLGTAEDYLDVSGNPDLWHPRKALPFLIERGILPLLEPAYRLVAARDPADTVVVASTLVFGARVAQEARGFRVATVHLQPSIFMSARQPPALAGLPLPGFLPAPFVRVLFNALERFAVDPLLAPALNGFRGALGLPPVHRILGAWVHSPWKVLGLFPDWFAPPQTDWPPRVLLPGFLRYDRAERGDGPDPAALRFLDAGEPPVVFTPGTAMRHAAAFFKTSLEACLLSGRRGLFITGHREQIPPGLPPTVHHAGYIPFSLAFPRAAAVVHHGGVGTTAQALAAGAPQVVMPFSHDQPDNGRRVERLGVGASISPSRYTARRAAALVDRLAGSAAVRARCRDAARRVDFEGALERACDILER